VNWSPFDGWEIMGWPVTTFVNGNMVYHAGQVDATVRGQEIKIA